MNSIKPTKWATKRSGTLNQFYTRLAACNALVAEINITNVRNVVDLGVGEGSLSVAIARRWPKAQFSTVDIDPTSTQNLHEALLEAGVTKHDHYSLDVMNVDFIHQLKDTVFDLAVCNPPFFRPQWKRDYADILQAADFTEACQSVSEVTAEILFLAQNLRLIRDGGIIALIVPDGLATGWKAKAFRKALLDKHTIRSVIQLPRYSFQDTEASCFILIIEKGRADKDLPIKLLRLDEHSNTSTPILIDHVAAEARLDWTFHSVALPNSSSGITLRKLGADIRRGSLSTVQRRLAEFPVFHTGDFPSKGKAISFEENQEAYEDNKILLAEEGDILLARVDRDLHEKITIVSNGKIAVTDCIFRLRLPKPLNQQIFDVLSSEQCRMRIQALTKGVGARLLGKGDLLDLVLY